MKENITDPKINFLKELNFNEYYEEELNNTIPVAAINTLNKNEEIVKININYLKDLGVNKYQEAFIRFYNMFLIEPKTFEEIFSKYDKDDLLIKLDKNIAIMEHL